MLMEVLAQQPAVRSGWQSSLRFQLTTALLFGVFLPALAYQTLILDAPVRGLMSQTSIGAGILAATACVLLLRRLSAFPGIRPVSQVLPTQTIVYGVVIAGILLLRLYYSIGILIACFAATLATLYVVAILGARDRPKNFWIVPGGHVDRLYKLPGFDYFSLLNLDDTNKANSIIVADLRHDHSPETTRMLADAVLRGIPVCHYKQIWEVATGRVRFDHLSENSFGSLLPSLSYRKVKRGFDLLICLIAAPFALVVMAIVAALIKMEASGPVLFRQVRVGFRGDVFEVVKFRTMRHQAESEEISRDAAITSKDDPRITPLGKFLRRTRIDELPQIWNILRGEMSWIGPRPEAVALARWYEEEIPFYSYRHIVRPGITGWAQVNQVHVTELDDVHAKLQFDFFYIKNFSYWLDILILVRTLKVVLGGFGAR
ncbi:MAG: sugar transferase [Sphingomonadaceae bacterium]|nr:sugar transferase [Sphingomonadaceae bacterium]